MELHNIDSLFRKAVNESAGQYEWEADQSKGRIWQQIQSSKKNRALPLLFRLLLAACILLFFSTSLLVILLSREKNNVRSLAEANRILKTETSLLRPFPQAEKVSVADSQAPSSDTVYINRKVIVYQPLISTEKQVDTVFIRQLVYTERDQIPEMITANPDNSGMESADPVQAQSSVKEIIISNKQSRNTGKKGKFLFKLGGNNTPAGNGTMAFTVNL